MSLCQENVQKVQEGVEDFQPLQKVGTIFHLLASLFY